jgi:hypothetical protein
VRRLHTLSSTHRDTNAPSHCGGSSRSSPQRIAYRYTIQGRCRLESERVEAGATLFPALASTSYPFCVGLGALGLSQGSNALAARWIELGESSVAADDVSGLGRPVGPGFKDRRVTATQHRRS